MTSRRDRALANGLLAFVAILVTAALLYTLLDPAVSDLDTMLSGQTSNSNAQDVIDERTEIWDLFLYYAVFLAGLMLIARSVFESRRPG